MRRDTIKSVQCLKVNFEMKQFERRVHLKIDPHSLIYPSPKYYTVKQGNSYFFFSFVRAQVSAFLEITSCLVYRIELLMNIYSEFEDNKISANAISAFERLTKSKQIAHIIVREELTG